ncbi:MAG TPA: hypothetical protein VJN94_03680 [Candidatus Binataceae bacterium]|nr:hypothetical protein [Candidatus Binataceae bacterium]
MKQLVGLVVAVVFAGTFLWVGLVPVQAAEAGAVEISSEGAPSTDLPMDQYHAFDQFRQSHPGIVREMGHDPSLIQSSAFQARHPELRELFQQHPGLQDALAGNPGDFLPLSPSAEASLDHRWHHKAHVMHRNSEGGSSAGNGATGTSK